MNKNNLIELILKEIKEMEVLTKGLSDFDNIPDLMFRLSDSKVNNIKDLFSLLKKETKEDLISLDTEKKETVEKLEKEKPIEIQEIEEAFNIIDETEGLEIEKTEDAPVVLETTDETLVISTTEITVEEPTIEEKKTESHKKHIIAETIIERKSSVNESLSTRTSSFEKILSGKKIVDLKKSINLNDKFRFQRELFKGNANLMNQTLDVLNDAANKAEALDFLSSLEWDQNEPTVAEFMELVNRKFLD